MSDPAGEIPRDGTNAARALFGLDPGELLARGLEPIPMMLAESGWEPPSLEEMTRLLPEYRIEALLGHGGMGAVYRAQQPALERHVAIKLLPAEMAIDDEFVARFQREARTLAKLNHPGIVTVHDFGQTSEGHLYFVMEFVDGTDLRTILIEARLPVERSLKLAGEVCEALHYAHSMGVVHRDIKPANILLTRDGRVKLADFGLSRPANEASGRVTSTNLVLGTFDYMAPEQRGGRADHRADIFSLGIMLYEMLTGERPSGVFNPPSRKVAVDPRLDAVVVKALQEDPDSRYADAAEMGADLEKIRVTGTLEKRWWRLIFAACGVALAGLLFGIWLGWKHPAKHSASSTPLEQALVSHEWQLWARGPFRRAEAPKGFFYLFEPNGVVWSRGLGGYAIWIQTGPRSFEVVPHGKAPLELNEGALDLNFNDDFTQFSGKATQGNKWRGWIVQSRPDR